MPKRPTIHQVTAEIQEEQRVRAEAADLLSSGEGRTIREKAGVSQREVAELTGVDIRSVGRWEKVHRPPPPSIARRYVNLINALRGES